MFSRKWVKIQNNQTKFIKQGNNLTMRQRLEKGQHFENGPKFTPFGRHVAEFVCGQAHYG